jgi:hypothetical protein
MKKLILESASSRRGAQVGRADVLPTNLNDPIKLRVEKLRWVDGDYDQFGAYWGGGGGTDIYCAWGEDGDHQVLVFVRAATRTDAKHLVLQKLPKASFCDGPPPKLTSLKPGGAGERLSLNIHPPFAISARLCAALQIGEAWISLEYAGVTGDGRTRYRYHIDLPGDFEHTADDLKSGVGGGSLQEGFGSLLSFLGAAAEGGENADLFPPRVVKWAHENADEIAALGCEVEEKQGLIDET